MEHHIKAPHDGMVAEILVEESQQLENGVPLLVIDTPEHNEGNKDD